MSQKISTTLSGSRMPHIAGKKGQYSKVEDEEAKEKFLEDQKQLRERTHYDYDGCIDLLGGFSKLQWYAAVCLILAFMSGGQILYGLTFLVEIYPQYECKVEHKDYSSINWDPCTRKHICDDNLPRTSWRINYDHPETYKNWIDPDKLDLTCTNEHFVGFIGAFYFIGLSISSALIPRAADQYGRKTPFIISMVSQTLAYTLIIFSKSLGFTIFLYFCVGLCAGGRMVVGVMYLAEFIPARHQTLVITMLFVADAGTMVLQSIYYALFQDWRFLHLFGILCQFTLLFLLGWIPESPKWFYANRMWIPFRESLKFISYFNESTITAEEIDKLNFATEVASFARFEKKITKTLNQSVQDDKEEEQEDCEKDDAVKLTGDLQQVLDIWQLRQNMICIMTLLSISSFAYYLLDLQIEREMGSVISNTIYSQTSEISAYAVAGIIFSSLGARNCLYINYSLALFGTILLFIFIDSEEGSELCFTIAKFGVSGSFTSIYLCAIMNVPTVYACSVFGYCNAVARIFTILAVDPTIAELEYPDTIIIGLLLGIIGILVSSKLITNLPKFE